MILNVSFQPLGKSSAFFFSHLGDTIEGKIHAIMSEPNRGLLVLQDRAFLTLPEDLGLTDPSASTLSNPRAIYRGSVA